jgi:hypothetical protein
MATPEDPTKTETSRALDYVRGVVGLFTGIAAVVYVAGGIVLGLRLVFLGLPPLGVVGQLPHEFLFSVGATQVVGPALILGIIAGLLQLMQDPDDVLGRSHYEWGEAKWHSKLRRSFVLFYVAAPLVLLAPGVVVAIVRADHIPHWVRLLGVLSVLAAAVVVMWVVAARKARGDGERDRESNPSKATRGEWFAVGAAGLVSVTPGVWVVLAHEHSARFFGVVAAWVITLLFVLLVPYLRGAIREWYAKKRPGVAAPVALSCLASALLFVPAFVALAAALPFPQATVCAKKPKGYSAAGRYVGETKERVYLGDDTNGRIVAVPMTEVSRVFVGKSAADTALCHR